MSDTAFEERLGGIEQQVLELTTRLAAVPAPQDSIMSTSLLASGLTEAEAKALIAKGGPVGAQILDSLNLTGAGERIRSVAAHRAAYEAPVWVETWANLTEWTLESAADVQVNANKLYGKTGTNSGLASRAFTELPGTTGAFRIVTTLNLLLGNTEEQVIGAGVTNEEAAAFAGFTGFFVNTKTGKTLAYYENGVQELGETLTAGTYYLTIVGDSQYISFTLMKSDRSVEAVFKVKRSVAGSVKRVMVINQDKRGLAGASLGEYIGARSSNATIAPRLKVEGVGISRTVWTTDKAGVNIRLELPASFDSRVPPLGWILFCHEAETTERAPMEQTTALPAWKALVEAGFAVASSAMSNEGLGTEASLTNALNLYRYLRENYPLTPIIVGGASAGGSAAALLVSRRTLPSIVGFFSVSGALNIIGNAGHSEEWAEKLIAEEYGTNGTKTSTPPWLGSNYIEKIVTPKLEPMLLAEQEPESFRGIPMLIIASSEDTVVNAAVNGEQFAAKLAGYQRSITTHFGKLGAHMAEGNWPPATIREFCEACVQN